MKFLSVIIAKVNGYVISSCPKRKVVKLCDSRSCGFEVDNDLCHKSMTTCAIVNH